MMVTSQRLLVSAAGIAAAMAHPSANLTNMTNTPGCFQVVPDYGCEDNSVFFRSCLHSSYNSAFYNIAEINATYPAECIEVDEDEDDTESGGRLLEEANNGTANNSTENNSTENNSTENNSTDKDDSKKKKKKKKKNKGSASSGYCHPVGCVDEVLPSDCPDCPPVSRPPDDTSYLSIGDERGRRLGRRSLFSFFDLASRSPNLVFRQLFSKCINYYFPEKTSVEVSTIFFQTLNMTDCPELQQYGF